MPASRTSRPLSNVECASHESPPNVGDSKSADETSRPVAAAAAASSRRAGATIEAICGESKVTAPYDSRDSSKTSAPRTRPKSELGSGRAGNSVRADSDRASRTNATWSR